MKKILALFILSAITLIALPQSFQPNWQSLDSRPVPDWFQDAKFGIFIHWGVYSVPAYRPLEPGLYASYAEWYYARVYKNEKNGGKAFHDKNYGSDFEYRMFAPQFKAELWDPDSWAKLFREAGARYVVLTSKHHDGFCLWPTKSPYKKDWNSMAVGPERDLVGDLTQAVRAEGLKMGLYYSIIEWESSKTARTETGYFLPADHIKKYKIPEKRYVDQHLIPQLKELVTSYKPSLIFADGGEWDGSEELWKTKEFLSWLYSESPVKEEVVVNDRFAKGMPGKHGDYYSSEYKDANLDIQHPWEESRGIGGSYGYNRAENLNDYSTSSELVHELIDIVSRGGNLLLNVGPTADGRIPVIQQQRLKDIGDWLKVNGEAIYKTRKSDLNPDTLNGIFFTKKNNSIYAIFTKWPENFVDLKLDSRTRIYNVSMLGVNSKVRYEKIGNSLRVYIPQLNYNNIPCKYAWALRLETLPEAKSLINGKDLTGWHIDVPEMDGNPDAPVPFIIRDGMLVSLGTPGGHLITDSEYSNYRLEIEYRFSDKPGNCGVLVHASTPRSLYKMFPKSLEVQMQHKNGGDFWCICEDIFVPDMVKRRGAKEEWGTIEGKKRRIENLTDDSENPVGEWNRMVIECPDDEIKVWINDDLVNHGFQCTATSGQIAIQAEGSEVEFRKILITQIEKK